MIETERGVPVLQQSAIALMTACLMILTACQAAATPGSEGTATPTPNGEATPMVVPTGDIVRMGDSVLLQAGQALVRRYELELGVRLNDRNWLNLDLPKYEASGNVHGETSADLLARLRTDEQLRTVLRDADVILFDVPVGMLAELCPDPGVPAEELCFDRVVPGYRADAAAIFAEVAALRAPEAIVRATDVWQFLGPTFHQAGTYDIARTAWQAMNQAVADAAAQYDIPLVHAYDLFSGPNGERDPVAAGDVEDDEVHLTPQGVQRFVEAFAALGFE